MNRIRRIAVVAGVTLLLAASSTTNASARPVLDPVDPLTNSSAGYVEPGNPDYFCAYRQLGSFSGKWCTYAPGQGHPTRHLVQPRPPVWWNPWTWF